MGHVNVWKAKHSAVEGALIPASIPIIVANAVVTVLENNSVTMAGAHVRRAIYSAMAHASTRTSTTTIAANVEMFVLRGRAVRRELVIHTIIIHTEMVGIIK